MSDDRPSPHLTVDQLAAWKERERLGQPQPEAKPAKVKKPKKGKI